VNFVNAPDGTLYVLDMSREILESIHVPLDVAQFLNFTHGRDHGRIYRLAPPGFKYPGAPQLDSATTDELVAALSHVHGWYRDTALRLLQERKDPRSISLLRGVLNEGRVPQGRLLALYGLSGFGALTEEDLARASQDVNPWIRKHAIALAEPFLSQSPLLRRQLIALTQDANPHVRMQVAFSLGELHDSSAQEPLATLAQGADQDTWLRAAILSSTADNAVPLLLHLWDSASVEREGNVPGIEHDLLQVIAAKHDPNELVPLLEGMAARQTKLDIAGHRMEYLDRLAQGLLSHGIRLDALAGLSPAVLTMLNTDHQNSLRKAQDSDAGLAERQTCIQRIAYASEPKMREILANLMQPSESDAIRLAAMRALSQVDAGELQQSLIEQWDGLSPSLAQSALDYLLDNQSGMEMFLSAAREGKMSVTILNGAARATLLSHPDEKIKQLARELLGNQNLSTRSSVIERYQKEIKGTADVAQGAAVFQRECQMCHKLGNVGQAVGPDLSSSAARDPDALLGHILDPNRYVDPRYVTYAATDRTGKVYSGILTQQSATSVTLTREQGRVNTILHADLDELSSTRLSLMPEGFEQRVNAMQMRDLIGFLQSQQQQTNAPLDIGTVPGLTEIGAPVP